MPTRKAKRAVTRGRTRNTIHPAWNPKHLGPRAVADSPAYGVEAWAYLTGRKLDLLVSVSHAGIQRGTVRYDIWLPRAQRAGEAKRSRTR